MQTAAQAESNHTKVKRQITLSHLSQPHSLFHLDHPRGTKVSQIHVSRSFDLLLVLFVDWFSLTGSQPKGACGLSDAGAWLKSKSNVIFPTSSQEVF